MNDPISKLKDLGYRVEVSREAATRYSDPETGVTVSDDTKGAVKVETPETLFVEGPGVSSYFTATDTDALGSLIKGHDERVRQEREAPSETRKRHERERVAKPK